jgi:transcriptional regulator with XRE-family HTH domain
MTRFGFLLACCALATSLGAQSLTDRFKEVRGPWELQLERGEASTVRKGVEALLGREGLTINPSDYNDMHALVALRGLAARACLAEGSWEDAVVHLQKAQSAAEENLATAEPFLAKTRMEHELKLKECQDAMAKQAPRLKELEEAPGLSQEQLKIKQQLKMFMDEQQAAITHSERALKDIETILVRLRQAKETTTKTCSDWQAFLAAEKAEIAEAGGVSPYVVGKLEQVKTNDARPRQERLTYARRLQKLDPANKDVVRLVNALIGKEEESEPAKPKKKSKAAPKKKT